LQQNPSTAIQINRQEIHRRHGQIEGHVIFFIFERREKYMRCVICGRELSNPVSIRRGMGPVCYAHQIEELRQIALEPEDQMNFFMLPEDSVFYEQPAQAIR